MVSFLLNRGRRFTFSVDDGHKLDQYSIESAPFSTRRLRFSRFRTPLGPKTTPRGPPEAQKCRPRTARVMQTACKRPPDMPRGSLAGRNASPGDLKNLSFPLRNGWISTFDALMEFQRFRSPRGTPGDCPGVPRRSSEGRYWALGNFKNLSFHLRNGWLSVFGAFMEFKRFRGPRGTPGGGACGWTAPLSPPPPRAFYHETANTLS